MKTIRFLLLFCLWIAFVSTALASSLTCGRCGKAIEGRYISYSLQGNKKLIVCESCDKKLPHCNACKLPYHAHDLVKHKNEKLCRTCLEHSLFCSLCESRIEGKYYQSKEGNEVYCLRCYNRYPRCVVCDRPGPVHRLKSGKTVCDRCLAKLPHCGACGELIVGTYYKFNNSDQFFCEKCKLSAFKCYNCGIPLGKHHWKFDDGRRICQKCNDRSIYDIKTIHAIMDEVETLCEKRLGLRVQTPYRVQVRELNNKSSTDAQKAKQGKNGDSPLFGKELGLYRRMNGKSEIFLLYGLPQEMLYDTAAHEYAHAWQAENCSPHQSPELLEGFAQWVSAQVLKIKGFEEAFERLEARRDNPYGTGYYKMKRIEQKLGRYPFYEYVKKAVK